MSKLKPIGSEKLDGLDKIQRIMEIARYKEVLPQSINEQSSREYQIVLADGNTYSIDKEKLGYVIKKKIDESFDYIEPMKNRSHYRSYSQAFKKLNLIAKEVNRLTETDEHISLFNEDKKYLLKTPKPQPEEEPQGPAPMGPPSAEAIAPPVDEPMPDMSSMGEEPPMDEPSMDSETPEMDSMSDTGEEHGMEEGGTSFKDIQKLTGKLTQKIRDIEEEQPLDGKDIKYVINSILSALNLDDLSSDDKDEIISRFEEDEDEDMMPSDNEDMDFDSEEEDMGEEMPSEEEPTAEVGESGPAHKSSIASNTSEIYGMNESKIENILSKYFTEESTPKKKKNKYGHILEMAVTEKQARVTKNLLEVSSTLVFLGRTNRKNLVFENGNQQIKITPAGFIL
jgi:hypothetical protein